MILSAPVIESPLVTLPVGFFDNHAREFAKLLTLGVDTVDALGSYYQLSPYQTLELVESSYFKSLLKEAQDELRDTNTVVEKARAMARLATPELVTRLISVTRNVDDLKVAKDAAETILNIAGLSTKAATSIGVGGPAGIAISISFDSRTPPVMPLKTVIEHDG